MTRPTTIWCCLFIVLVNFSLIGCAGRNGGSLNLVQEPTEDELRRDWNAYTVYYLRSIGFNLALVYKIKDNRKIILDSRWIEVSSEEAMANSIIAQSA